MNWPWGKAILEGARKVRRDWTSALAKDKELLFNHQVSDLEGHYGMFSVVLDEAYRLKETAQLVQAREAILFSVELMERLGEKLTGSLLALQEHAKHYGTLPNIMPLNEAFFRGEEPQSKATWARRIGSFQSSRPRFFMKVRTLREIVNGIGKEYAKSAEEIGNGACVAPDTDWVRLEMLHYDLNTCMRETMVVLKSFLCAMPVEQVECLQAALVSPVKRKSKRIKATESRAWT